MQMLLQQQVRQADEKTKPLQCARCKKAQYCSQGMPRGCLERRAQARVRGCLKWWRRPGRQKDISDKRAQREKKVS